MTTLSVNITADSFHNDEIYELRINDDVKIVDQFTKSISFSLKDSGTYRIYFEQKRREHLPEYINIPLMLILLPLRGIYNILTFNSENEWFREAVAFRLSGYVDIEAHEGFEMEWRVIGSYYDPKSNVFVEPLLEITPSSSQTLSNVYDDSGIRRAYNAFLKNLASVSIWFYVLFGYLFGISVYNENLFAMIAAGSVLIILSCVILGIIFVNRRRLIKMLCCMEPQCPKHSI